jgi:hypothetical protein
MIILQFLLFYAHNYRPSSAIFFTKLIQEKNYGLLLKSAWQHVSQSNICHILRLNTPCIPIHFPCCHTNHTWPQVQIESSYLFTFPPHLPWNLIFQPAFLLIFRILCTPESNLATYKFITNNILCILQLLRGLAITVWIVDIYYTFM